MNFFLSVVASLFCFSTVAENVAREDFAQVAVQSGVEKKGVLAGLAYAEKLLPNGMRVVAIRQPSAPKVTVEVVVAGVGSLVERGAERGWAHLLEHMIFKGTDKMSELTYNVLQSRYGAHSNAFTWTDCTGYYVQTTQNNWQPFVKLYAQCLSDAAIDAQHLASEVKVVIKELRRNIDDPEWQMIISLLRECYPEGHPYNSVTIGYKKDLAAVRAEKLKEFFKKYYQPQFMTLFIVGDVDLDEALECATAEMSLMPDGKTVLPAFDQSKYQLNDCFYKQIESDTQQECVQFMWRCPGGLSDETYALELLKQLLVGGHSKILEKRLVHEQKCASSVRADSMLSAGDGMFILGVQPMPGKKDECVAIIRHELDALAKNGVDAQFLSAIKNKIALQHAYTIDRLGLGIPTEWIMKYAINQNLHDCFDFVSRFQSVTSEQIAAVIKKYLIPEKTMRVDLVPRAPENVAAYTEFLKNEQALEAEILGIHGRTRPLEDAIVPAEYPFAQAPIITLPAATAKKTFSNGLSVVVKQEAGELAIVSLDFKKSDLKQRTKTVLAFEMLGEWLFSGSTSMSKDEIYRWFDNLGVELAVDGLSISLIGAKKNIIPAMSKVAEIIKTAVCSEDTFESIKNRMVESLKSDKDDARAVAGRLLRSKLCANSAYDWTFDDAISFVELLTPRDLQNYFCGYFNPSKMSLVVVGDVDSEEVFDLVAHESRLWTSHMVLENYDFGEQQQGVFTEKMVKNQVWMMWGRRSEVSLHHAKKPIIDVLSTIFYDRVYNLREETGLYYVITGSFATGFSRAPATDSIMLQTGPEHVTQTVELIKKFLATAAVAPVTHEELEAAKNKVKTAVLTSFSGIAGRASWLSKNERLGLTPEYFEKYLTAIDALTVEQASAELAAYVFKGPFTQVNVGMLE